jgi:uncharacterized C2H2 Zn-finger protein
MDFVADDIGMLPGDLEVFQRIMRAMNALQNGSMNLSAPMPSQWPQPLESHNLPDLDALFDDGDDEDEDSDSGDSEDQIGNEEEGNNDMDFGEEADGEDDDIGFDDSEEDGDIDGDDCSENDHAAFYPDDIFLSPDDPASAFPGHEQPEQHPSPTTRALFGFTSDSTDAAPQLDLSQQARTGQESLRCWEHGCNGRKFTTRSNFRRHLREKSNARPSCRCPQCGAVFSRTTARNAHVAKGSCNRIRRYSNGRVRPNLRVKDH